MPSETPHTPDPKCPWCDGDGWTPFLVEHPEDGTTHIEYHSCVCTKPRTKASELFPHLQKQFARKKDDGRAEALLLAVFWVRFSKR